MNNKLLTLFATLALCVTAFAGESVTQRKTNDKDKFRTISGTQSPNGEFALGFGLDGKNIDWNKLYDSQMGAYYVDPDTQKNILNYIVDTKTGSILGKTGCEYFGTATNFNVDSCDVSWSPDSRLFVQVIHWKWFSLADAGRINSKFNSVKTIDFQTKANAFACAFLAAHKKAAYLTYKNHFAISIETKQWDDNSTLTVGNDGVIKFRISVEVPKSEDEDSAFELDERLQLSDDMHLRLLGIDFAPTER